MRARPARVKDPGPASGPLGPLARGQGIPPSDPWLRGSLQAGKSKPSGRPKENRPLNAHVSGRNCFCRVCLTLHQQELRSRAHQQDVGSAHEGPTCLPSRLHRLFQWITAQATVSNTSATHCDSPAGSTTCVGCGVKPSGALLQRLSAIWFEPPQLWKTVSDRTEL